MNNIRSQWENVEVINMYKERIPANSKPMLNAYPDSVGGTLTDIISFLKRPELENVYLTEYFQYGFR